MNKSLLILVFCAGFFLHSCGESPLDSHYNLELPKIPRGWEVLLGSPHWQIEWVNDEGRKGTKTVQGNGSPEISLPPTLPSAVSAFPYWPDRGIGPGIFKPAGAIFPFDASGKTLVLSWQGGVDANLFWELAQAYHRAEEENAVEQRAVLRLPWNFNWPRFRELFDDPSLNAEVRIDPWLADWHSIAAKIIQSGFDKRRLVPEARSSLEVPVNYGPWIGTSPFAPPLFFDTTPVFSVRPAADTWVSAEGILRCNSKTWILIP